MKNSDIDALVLDEVRNRIRDLRGLDAQDLRTLPRESVENLCFGGKSLTVCTYRDPLKNGECLVIVQCKNTRFFGYGKMMAEGIVVGESGEKRNAEEELLWEYV